MMFIDMRLHLTEGIATGGIILDCRELTNRVESK